MITSDRSEPHWRWHKPERLPFTDEQRRPVRIVIEDDGDWSQYDAPPGFPTLQEIADACDVYRDRKQQIEDADALDDAPTVTTQVIPGIHTRDSLPQSQYESQMTDHPVWWDQIGN